MKMKLLITFSVLVFADIICQTNGLCNECGHFSTACVDADKLRACKEGVPEGRIIQCPPGYFCTQDYPCVPVEFAVPECKRCANCNDRKIFACTKNNAFSLCTGDETYGPEYICPEGLVCSTDTNFICIDPETTGINATCPWVEPIVPTTTEVLTTTTTTTRTTTTINPNDFCANKGFPGRYEDLTDTTCRQFITCIFYLNGSWVEKLYSCPKGTYFNGKIQACDKDIPARCA